jgi:heparan-alpha-glucosaminide N-acetyltransferase
VRLFEPRAIYGRRKSGGAAIFRDLECCRPVAASRKFGENGAIPRGCFSVLHRMTKVPTQPLLEPSAASGADAAPARIGSIDAYRGLVMFLMAAEVLELRSIAKNVPTDFWKFLAWHQTHVEWAGCTLHDLIQPSFSFLVGVALPFSIASRLARGQSKWWMTLHALWRAILLVLLGVFLRSMSRDQTNWTFEDTLSQIGLGYLPLFLLGFTRQRWQWVALAVVLVGYWGYFAFAPLPAEDFPYADYGVDEKYNFAGFAAHWNKNSNPAWSFDQWFMNLFPREKPFTHNGGGYSTLSFIPTLGTMILGLIAGGWLRQPVSAWTKFGWLMIAGGLCLAAGWILHETGLAPAVKRIWTPGWTLYSGGWCFFLLAAFYGVIDCGKLVSWSFPLRVIGANSILAYIMAHGWENFIIRSFHIHFGKDVFRVFGEAYEPLVAGATVLAIFWLILFWLYRQRIFIRI